MADAIVFGAPNTLANRVADTLSDALHTRERYQQSLEQLAQPGVAIVTTTGGLSSDAPALAFADGLRKDPKIDDQQRRAWLTMLAEGAARGAFCTVLTDTGQTGPLKARLKADGVPKGEPLCRLLVINPDPGRPFSEDFAPAIRAERIAIDEPSPADDPDAWPQRVAEEERWVVETGYTPALRPLINAAGLVVVIDQPSPAAAPVEERPPLHQRIVLGILRRTYAPIAGPRVERDLAAFAHRTPILVVRNDGERQAVAEALLRGAALPSPAHA